MGGHDQKSHGDGNYGAHELDPNPVDGCHGGELMQVCLTTFFFKKKSCPNAIARLLCWFI